MLLIPKNFNWELEENINLKADTKPHIFITKTGKFTFNTAFMRDCLKKQPKGVHLAYAEDNMNKYVSFIFTNDLNAPNVRKLSYIKKIYANISAVSFFKKKDINYKNREAKDRAFVPEKIHDNNLGELWFITIEK